MRSLEFDNISFGYVRNNLIFKDTSFKIEYDNLKGHIVSLMGSSASGKTTILKLILESLNLIKGNIIHNPQNPIISYIPQEPVLFEHLTPKQNAHYFSRLSYYKNRFDFILIDKFSHVLEMEDALTNSRSILELSVGQKQRLSLLRALSIKPNILLLDEPTTGIDADLKLQFIFQLLEVIKEQNILAIYVTHHKSETQLTANEVLYLAINAETGLTDVYHKNIIDFFNSPPTSEAAISMNYPNSNLINVTINSGEIQLATQNSNDTTLIEIDPQNIKFDNYIGFPIKVLHSNSVFTIIEINSDQKLILKLSPEKINGEKCIISGQVNSFKSNKFHKKINVVDNKIVE